jgi:hypothetical protein
MVSQLHFFWAMVRQRIMVGGGHGGAKLLFLWWPGIRMRKEKGLRDKIFPRNPSVICFLQLILTS